MEDYYEAPVRRRKLFRFRPIMAAAACILLLSLMLATCGGDASITGKELPEPVLDKVGRRIQQALAKSVSINSDGVIAFPREVMEIVLENHDIQVSTRYESTGWLGLGKSHVVMGGTYRARIGFDLGRASAEVEGNVLRLWLPEPEIICLETVRVGRQAEDVSFWNPLEPTEMESAYKANRAEAESCLNKPELLKGASNRLIQRLHNGLSDMGFDVRVEFLPQLASRS